MSDGIVTSNLPGQAEVYPSSDDEGNGDTSPTKVQIPEVDESFMVVDLDDNMRQTHKFKTKLIEDRKSLNKTKETCEELIKKQFGELQQKLYDREELLITQLKARYDDRNNKLTKQINTLEKHLSEVYASRTECLNLVDREEKSEERLKKIKNLRNKCIYNSPQIFEVPIDIRYDCTKDETLKEMIEKNGKLTYRRIEHAKQLYFYETQREVREETSIIGTNNNINDKNSNKRKNSNVIPRDARDIPASDIIDYNKYTQNYISSYKRDEYNDTNNEINIIKKDVILPVLNNFNLKYNENNNKILCEIIISDPNVVNDEKTELLDEKVDNYVTRKNDNIYLNIQCIATQNEQNINWDKEKMSSQSYVLLSGTNNDGSKYTTEIPTKEEYKDGMVIYSRVRLVYVESEVDIKDNSDFADIASQYVVKGGIWSKESKIILNKSINIINDIDSLPELIRFRCYIDVGDKKGGLKPISLLKKDNEYNLIKLISKIRRIQAIKNIDPNGKRDINIILTKDNNKEIKNDENLFEYVLSKSKDCPHGDLQDTLGIKAILLK